MEEIDLKEKFISYGGIMKTIFKGLILLCCLTCRLTAGTWTPLNNQPTFLKGVGVPLLLTDGSVLFSEQFFEIPSTSASTNNATGLIWKLTPDIYGSYVNGTWSQLATLPTINEEQYAPVFYASAVLADGRVIFEGGEINGLNNYVWTNKGAIYDPIANSWTPVAPPPFFNNLVECFTGPVNPNAIGDASGIILENGVFMLANQLGRNAALFDSKTQTWTETGFNKFDLNTEEGWTLLPNGQVLTVNTNVDVICNPNFVPNLTGSEKYDPKTGFWTSAGSTIVPLSDFGLNFEIGPGILRPDGTVLAFGGDRHTGNNAIYNTKTGTWTAGPQSPETSPGNFLTTADAPAALLPNGNVLVAMSPRFTRPPVHIFEVTLGSNTFVEQPTTPNAVNIAAYYANMLILPTGQILMTDTSNDVEIYTPSDMNYNPKWAPKIYSSPKEVFPGKKYKIKGIRFNGMSQGAMYGDDYQAATNYPLVRITNCKTGHVFYCRTHDHSFMGVASKKTVYTFFDVPFNIEPGKSKIEVVANGIPSKSKCIYVKSCG